MVSLRVRTARRLFGFFVFVAFVLGSASLEAQGPRRGRRTRPSQTVVRNGVHVLSERTLATLVGASEDGRRLVFRGLAAELRRIQGGDVIVAGVSARTPHGFLRRVTRISPIRGGVLFETEPATLEDVFWSGSARYSARMLPSDVSSVRSRAKGVRVPPLPGGGLSEGQVEGPGPQSLFAPSLGAEWSPQPIQIELLDVVVFDLDEDLVTTGDQVKLYGKVGVAPSFEVELDLSWGRVREFHFTNSNELSSELRLEGDVFVPLFDEKVILATFRFTPVVVMVGPVPLVFTPVLDVEAGAKGELSAGVRGFAAARFEIAAGIHHENGAWRGEASYPKSADDIEVDWTPPEVWAEARVQAYAGPRATFLLYGVLGPFARVHGYSDLSAEFLPRPYWALYLGLRGDIGLAEGIPIIAPSYVYPIFDRKWKVAEGSFLPF